MSGSTSTSTMLAAYEPPEPPGFMFARPTTGPPVSMRRPAISRKLIRSSESDLWRSPPSAYSMSSGSASHSRDARTISCWRTSIAASCAAQPDLNATPLPPVTDV